jgi:hypothetical protein
MGSWIRDHELRNALVDRLLELSDQGFNDPELEIVALESMPVDTRNGGAGETVQSKPV